MALPPTTSRAFTTLMVLLLATALVLLTMALGSSASYQSLVNANLTTAMGAGAEADMASFGIRQILAAEGVNVTYSVFNANFTDNVSTLANYSADLSRYASFAQGRSAYNLSINTTEASRPKFYLRPLNITVDYPPGGFNVTPFNSTASAGHVVGYNVLLVSPQPALHLNWTNRSNVSNSSADALFFHVGLQGSNGTAADTVYLNRSAYSELRLLNASNKSIATLRFFAPAALSITYDTSLAGRFSSEVQLNSSSYSELGASIINIPYGAGTKARVIAGES